MAAKRDDRIQGRSELPSISREGKNPGAANEEEDRESKRENRARLFFLSSLSSGRRPKLSCENSVTEEATGDPFCCYRQDMSPPPITPPELEGVF